MSLICPYCYSEIPRPAVVCPHCTRDTRFPEAVFGPPLTPEGKIEHAGMPYVLLSLRTDVNSFKVTNIALSASQARRLLNDLATRFKESAFLNRVETPDPELRLAYHRIMLEEKGFTVVRPPHE